MRLSHRNPRIVVVDDFYENPLEVRSMAMESDLHEAPEYHKGRRSSPFPIPADVRAELGRLLRRPVGDGYACFQVCVAGDQLVYHSDAQMFAAAVYLTPDAPLASGTSMYRSKASGLRSAPTEEDAIRRGVTVDHLQALTYKDKLLDATQWDEVDRIGNVFNRLTMWDARLLHAATGYFGHSVETGRLFQMYFFDAGEPF